MSAPQTISVLVPELATDELRCLGAHSLDYSGSAANSAWYRFTATSDTIAAVHTEQSDLT